MPRPTRIAIVVGISLMLTACSVCADESVAETGWLAQMEKEAKEGAVVAARPAAADAAEDQWEKPLPLTFTLDYSLVSDYIWRGINFSEYADEGSERLNHQFTVGIELATEKLLGADFGNFGTSLWFQFYNCHRGPLTSAEGQGALQEIDYALYWNYYVKPLSTKFETGWISYTFPQLSGDANDTSEWYFSLAFDDKTLFKTKENVVNPTLSYYLDLDDVQASVLVFDMSHPFELAALGCERTPILKDITITPTFQMIYEFHYYTRATGLGDGADRLTALNYGLDVTYDLGSALNIPEKYGSLSLSGFLNFSHALRRAIINDEFYGGFKIAYEW